MANDALELTEVNSRSVERERERGKEMVKHNVHCLCLSTLLPISLHCADREVEV